MNDYKLKPFLGVFLCVLYLALTVVVVFSAGLPADTIIVTNTKDSGPGSLRQAVENAQPDDTITFDLPSGSTIDLTSSSLAIEKDLTIMGPEGEVSPQDQGDPPVNQIALNGGNNQRLMTIMGDVNVSILWLDLLSGNANQEEVAPGFGGGIYISGGNFNGEYLNFFLNTAEFAGGAIYNNGGTTTLSNSSFKENSSTNTQSHGGAIASVGVPGFDAELTINNVRIEDNHTVLIGGAISNLSQNGSSTVQAKDLICVGNTAEEGGCVFNGKIASAGNATFSLDGANIFNNIAQVGAGLENNNGFMYVVDSILTQNSAGKTGAAVASNGQTDIGYSMIVSNVVSSTIGSTFFTVTNSKTISIATSIIYNDSNCIKLNTISNNGYNIINSSQCFPDGQNGSEVQPQLADWIKTAVRRDSSSQDFLEIVPYLWINGYEDFIPIADISSDPAVQEDYRGEKRPLGVGASPGPLEYSGELIITKEVKGTLENDQPFKISFLETNVSTISTPMTQDVYLQDGQSTQFRLTRPLLSGVETNVIIAEDISGAFGDYETEILCDNGQSSSGTQIDLKFDGQTTTSCTIFNTPKPKPIIFLPIIIK